MILKGYFVIVGIKLKSPPAIINDSSLQTFFWVAVGICNVTFGFDSICHGCYKTAATIQDYRCFLKIIDDEMKVSF